MSGFHRPTDVKAVSDRKEAEVGVRQAGDDRAWTSAAENKSYYRSPFGQLDRSCCSVIHFRVRVAGVIIFKLLPFVIVIDVPRLLRMEVLQKLKNIMKLSTQHIPSSQDDWHRHLAQSLGQFVREVNNFGIVHRTKATPIYRPFFRPEKGTLSFLFTAEWKN